MPTDDTGDRAAPQLQAMTHPSWCDRGLCTAPTHWPADVIRGDHYHRSPPITLAGGAMVAANYHIVEGLTAQLTQSATTPWISATFVNITANDVTVTVALSTATTMLTQLADLLQRDQVDGHQVDP